MGIGVAASHGECLRVKADWCYLQVTLCNPYLSALKAFAKTRYANRRLPLPMGNHMPCHPAATTFPPLPQPKLVLDLATPK